jgi:universal stress protein E
MDEDLAMTPYRSLLVGIDFTPSSVAALRQALRIGARSGTLVRAVHILDTLVVIELEEALSEFQRNIREGLLSDARKAWSEFALNVPGAQEIPFDVRINNRTVEVTRAAQEHEADLLILGAFGRRPVDVGLGTMATACVRNAPSDVLLVRDTHAGGFKTIVVGVDFSETSALALRRAAELALLDKAELHVLHVFDPPWHRLHYRAPTVEVAPHFIKQYSDGLSRRLAEFTGSTLSTFPAAPALRCELFDDGSHRSGIVARAQLLGADLIVLGTRGQSNVRDILLGSTAERVLKNTTCSVLAVKPRKLTRN